MEKGKLIVIEGCVDGIGKSTQMALLKEKLVRDGIDIVSHHFPSYGTYQGAIVEHYLRGEYGDIEQFSPYFANGAFAMDRAVTWISYLRPQYEEGKLILLDRYTTSSLIYQAAVIKDIEERKRYIDYIIDYEYNKLGIKEPDETIFLSADFDTIAELRSRRKENEGISNDLHERNREYMKRVYENSMFISKYLGWSSIECDKNGQMRTIEDINKEVYTDVKRLIKN